MKCLWCESETTSNEKLATSNVKYANREHIFPEAVGGIKTLEVGKVCECCNTRLGDQVDKHLKTENFMMMKQYQDSLRIKGKPPGKSRKGINKKRKIEEGNRLSGYSGGSTIERDPEHSNRIKLTNMPDGTYGDFTYNNRFSKALHKCAINVLLDSRGYDYLKKNHNELIDFINSPNNSSYYAWSYAVCYANIFPMIHFEPFCLQQLEVENVVQAVVLLFPCAIFIVCMTPNIMSAVLLEIVGSNPPTLENWNERNFNYIERYQSAFGYPRKTFGEKLKFTLIKKQIDISPSPQDTSHLLACCNICGQANPTGVLIHKSCIPEKPNDLSSSNVAKSMNIANCQFQCINCGEFVTYDAEDCFL